MPTYRRLAVFAAAAATQWGGGGGGVECAKSDLALKCVAARSAWGARACTAARSTSCHSVSVKRAVKSALLRARQAEAATKIHIRVPTAHGSQRARTRCRNRLERAHGRDIARRGSKPQGHQINSAWQAAETPWLVKKSQGTACFAGRPRKRSGADCTS